MLLISGARRPRPLVRASLPAIAATDPAVSRTIPLLGAVGEQTLGRILVLVAFATAGIGSVVSKGALDAGATPVAFLTVRLAAAVLVLFLVCGRRAVRLPGRRVLQLLVLGLGFASQSLIYFTALERTPVAVAVAVVCTYPLVIIVSDAVASRTLPSRRVSAGMVLALLGLWVVAGRPVTTPDSGVLLAFAAAVAYGTYLRVSAKHMSSTTPVVATTWVLTGAFLAVLVASVVTGQQLPPVAAMQLAGLHGAVMTTIPIVAIYAALRRMPAGQMAALGPLEPVVAAGVAAVLLGEALPGDELAGIAVLILSALCMAGVRPRVGLPRVPIALPPRRRSGVGTWASSGPVIEAPARP